MNELSSDRRNVPLILYVINSFDGGGAESGLLAMVRGGVFADCRLRIIALVRGSGGIEAQLAEAGHEPEILLDQVRMHVADLPRLYQRLRKRVHELRPNILIASLPQANLLARLSVMFCKEILFVSFEHNSHLAKRFYEIGYRLTSSRVDWVFADAESTLKTVLQRLYRRSPAERTIVPLVSFASQGQRAESIDGTFHIVNAARFTPPKNQSALIEAVASLQRDVTLTLYGDGPTRGECIALARRLGIAERVHFPGFVSDWSRYPADLFVLPSRHEGLCIVVLEAMNAGIPIAAPLIGGLRDYADTDVVRVLDATDAHTIATAIVQSIENKTGDHAMAGRAARVVQHRFGAGAVRAIYGEINHALIGAAQARFRRQGNKAVVA